MFHKCILIFWVYCIVGYARTNYVPINLVLRIHDILVWIQNSQNRINQGFSYHFCLMIEGSRRPKNTWIRIRIRNTELNGIFETQ
jgi:hypothetical protein